MPDENDTTNEDNGGKGLRAQLETALARIKDLEAENASFKTTARESEVKSFLEGKGIKPGYAKFIGSDVKDLDTWLTENAELVGYAPGGTPGAGVTADEVSETQRLQTLTSSAVPAGKAADIQARMANAKDNAELDAIWQEARQLFL